LSAALPRVVDGERLVVANSLSPTAGTLAATLGGGVAFVVRFLAPGAGRDADALVLLTAAAVYLLAGLASLRMGRELLGPDPAEV
ncbi:MFS transporter, partial [Streptomyces nanshensis]